MNVVFSVRFFLSSMTTIFLILLPRAVSYFGLENSTLDTLVSPWATFLILIFVGFLIMYPWLKNIKIAVFLVLGILGAAAIMTFYFCELPLPW